MLAGLGHALVSSTKAMHGHTMGAAGGVEAIAALMPIVRGMTPPSVNLDAPDDESELDFVVDGRARDPDRCDAVEQLRLRRAQRGDRPARHSADAAHLTHAELDVQVQMRAPVARASGDG